ncbi:glucosaminidase domain-containing protein [Rossellomorea marisflavi]|uniref:glucosaminidase domain-containing protein n=1 Tax=Rossellomorea marisflavi TaxID=189381 RepID=UPI00285333D7|nr:glucosaminidase domain-containing protein [Rossellomorea marisflavi]MDR4935261.1 glucosaminidase domain-containing protein [Rossellomorea marisflavi]
MFSYKRIFSSLLALTLVFSGFSGLAQAASNDVVQNALVKNAKSDAIVHVYSEPSEDSDILSDLEDDAIVSVETEEGLDPLFTKVSYKDEESGKDLTGYVLSEFIEITEDTPDEDTVTEPEEPVEADEPVAEEPSDVPSEEVTEEDGSEKPEEEPTTDDALDSKAVEEEAAQEEETSKEEAPVEEPAVVEEEKVEPKATMRATTFAAASMDIGGTPFEGIALKSPTAVYEKTSQTSKKLKTYSQGSVLKYKSLNSNWYVATVYLNGKPTIGYIPKKDVSNITAKQVTVQGIAVKEPTKIYSLASTGSSVLKTYNQGSSLKYQTLVNGWYVCVVYVNGKYVRGYIKSSDVQQPVSEQTTVKGITKQTTNVYKSASTGAGTLKSYPANSVLTYRTFINGWYEATVYIRGKKTTGYIKASDVSNVSSNQTDMRGPAKLGTTPVYSGLSTDSSVLKSYPAGTVLLYKSFISGWYEATVYVNGKRTTGYIYSGHVTNATNSPQSMKGLSINSAKVYTGASRSTDVIKGYSNGTLLSFKTFVSGWYETTVSVNGTTKTGYLDASQIETVLSKQEDQQGLALNSPTSVYTKASTSAGTLKSYSKGTVLKYKTLSENWYEAVVYIKGAKKTGYIYKKDVKTLGTDVIQDSTDYGVTIEEMLAKQMQSSPQTDKYRNDPAYIYADYVDMNKGIVTENRVNVRSSPSTASTSNIVQMLNKGDGVMIMGKTGNWVEVRITWKNATSSDVMQYLNPDNVMFGSKEYYQFLKLSLPANLSVSEINQKILKGKGILEGKGQAFVDAANKFKVNEVYLISHALLETGNGTSNLAKGTVKNGKTVYNMYGYGAYDSCALECGSQAAYDNGWFTPEDAIIGGAQKISQGYIYRDGFQQDTLYKMRWNPESTHQYATDVGWAAKQVGSIYNIYSLLDNYTLYFDKPFYTLSK